MYLVWRNGLLVVVGSGIIWLDLFGDKWYGFGW